MSEIFVVHCDGGARGNPGPAGIGVVIEREGKVVAKISEYVGEMTNNQAEYRALIIAMEKVKELGGVGETIDCFLDSELLVEQLQGNYRVKNTELKPLFSRVQELGMALGGNVRFEAVPRGQNKEADQLVNLAIDTALKLS